MKYLLGLSILFSCTLSHAQVNLVKNPSFEVYSTCPSLPDEITNAVYWNSLDSAWRAPDWAHDLSGVPDLCHTCAGSNIHIGVPVSMYQYQYPHLGEAMAEVQMFYNEGPANALNKRDYLQGHLSTSLVAGKSYCVTFHTVLAEASLYAIKDIGAYLDDGTIDTTHNPSLPQTMHTPQVVATGIISDTMNWVKVQGSFIATGKERLITIGNFKDKAHTTYIPAPGVDTTGTYLGDSYTWYLIDDVSVIESEAQASLGPDKHILSGDSVLIGTKDGYLPAYWYTNGVLMDSNTAGFYVHPTGSTTYVMALDVCGNITYDTLTVYVGPLGLSNAGAAAGVVVLYPNPAPDELTIEQANGCSLMIYDAVGRVVFQSTINNSRSTINIQHFTSGVYIAQIHNPATGIKTIRRFVRK